MMIQKSFRITTEILKEIEKISKIEKRGKSEVVRILIEEAIEARRKKKNPLHTEGDTI